MPYLTVLVTGAPASGKTTLAAELAKHLSPLRSFDFGKLILQNSDNTFSYEALRSNSNALASPSLVDSIDERLVTEVVESREHTNIFIDSHAVTHELFGFRVTPSGLRVLQRLQLDCIVVLHCPAELRVERIAQKADGRLSVTLDEARHHQALQESVAVTYGIVTGCPIFVVDAREEPLSLAKRIKSEIFVRLGMTHSWVD